ncbi:MAG: hypothetical protein ABSG68_15285 [Thermoguttaceae bacterium]
MGRRWNILVGYNLPLLLWTAAALAGPNLGAAAWRCPVQALLGWCPACGLTGAYGRFLRGQSADSFWLLFILAGFAVNTIISIVRAVRQPVSCDKR